MHRLTDTERDQAAQAFALARPACLGLRRKFGLGVESAIDAAADASIKSATTTRYSLPLLVHFAMKSERRRATRWRSAPVAFDPSWEALCAVPWDDREPSPAVDQWAAGVVQGATPTALAAIEWCWVRGWSEAEAAKRLGMSRSATSKALARLRSKHNPTLKEAS